MEHKLKKIFDYQRFEKNEKLEKLIHETESRYTNKLSDDELSFVNAAGDNTGTTNPSTLAPSHFMGEGDNIWGNGAIKPNLN